MNTRINYFTAGLTIFAMFFGAGNIFLPLALSQQALDKTPWALGGFLITAVGMPIAGLLAMFQFGGQIRLFFSRLGKVPGFCIAFLTIALLGPFGAAPRCITLAHSTMSTSIQGISLILFSGIACALVFCFAYRKNRMLKLIGYVLAPFKVTLLIWIIVKGFIDAPGTDMISSNPSEVSHFWHGLKEGYMTMDLLAAFFFAPIIIASLSHTDDEKNFSRFVIKASAIGAFLLAAVYIGFCYLAYFYAAELQGIPSDKLLGVIAIKVLGPHAGLIMALTVCIACLTTAIALIAAFASFLHKEVFKEKVGHVPILTASLLLTFAVTTLEFQGIAHFLNPILTICYPVLIVLTFYNLIKPPRTWHASL